MRKRYVTFPIVGFIDFLERGTYRSLKRPFYKANILGFLDSDIDKEESIFVNEFDEDAIPEPPFVDTSPNEIQKHLVDDYLVPLIEKTKIRREKQLMLDYQKVQNFGGTAILNLKENSLEEINTLLIKAKEVKHLPPNVKPLLIEALKANLKFTNNNINTNFANDFQSKIKLRLGIKDICHLMLFLNEHNLFEKKLKKKEIARMIEEHFQSQVGTKDDFKIITNATTSLSNSINSESHYNLNPKLNKILVDFSEVLSQVKKG